MAQLINGHLVETGNGLGKSDKFVKTFSAGSSEHLAIEKIDQLVMAVNALIVQFNAFLAHVDVADVTGIGNANVATFAGVAVAQTASDQLIQSPPKTSL